MTARVALVTGGIGGIGTAICRHLAQAGHRVATNYRDEGKAKAWQAAQKADGFEFALAAGDVSDVASAESMVGEVENQLGPIDILINNAGITRDTTFHKMSRAAVAGSHQHQPQFLLQRDPPDHRRHARTQVGTHRPDQFDQRPERANTARPTTRPRRPACTASRFRWHRKTPNSALPSTLFRRAMSLTEMVMAVPEDVRAKIAAQIPVGRLGEPDEIAYAVGFLTAEQASWITGANLSINGGHYMGW